MSLSECLLLFSQDSVQAKMSGEREEQVARISSIFGAADRQFARRMLNFGEHGASGQLPGDDLFKKKLVLDVEAIDDRTVDRQLAMSQEDSISGITHFSSFRCEKEPRVFFT